MCSSIDSTLAIRSTHHTTCVELADRGKTPEITSWINVYKFRLCQIWSDTHRHNSKREIQKRSLQLLLGCNCCRIQKQSPLQHHLLQCLNMFRQSFVITTSRVCGSAHAKQDQNTQNKTFSFNTMRCHIPDFDKLKQNISNANDHSCTRRDLQGKRWHSTSVHGLTCLSCSKPSFEFVRLQETLFTAV